LIVESQASVASAKTRAKPLLETEIRQTTWFELRTRDLQLEMPVDVTVEEPRSGVVSRPADGNIISGITNANHITTRRVIVVVIRLSSRANDVKDVAVQMERMGSACYSSGHGKLDHAVLREVVDGAFGHQLVGSVLSTEELQENRERRGLEGGAVDCEDEVAAVKSEIHVNVDVRIPNTGSTRLRREAIERYAISSQLFTVTYCTRTF
jgi:hypothetical protein